MIIYPPGDGGGGQERAGGRDIELDSASGAAWGRQAVYVTGLAYGGALLVSIGLLLTGGGVLGAHPRESLVTAGLIGLILVLTLAPAALIIAVWTATSPVAQLSRRLLEVQDAVRVISEQAALSDDARRVLNRSTEREMLRRAIEQDIVGREWEAAIVLCEELANRFGYRADAEEFRARIETARFGDLDAATREGFALIDGMILQRRWDDAAREAARLARLYPQHQRCAAMPEHVAQARANYKGEVVRRFGDAAAGDRIEEAMAMLKELDTLLSEAEAAPLKDTARAVIAKARDQAGAQFREAVEEQDWADAANIGRRIIAEFPNTKMASEVRAMLDNILVRANAAG